MKTAFRRVRPYYVSEAKIEIKEEHCPCLSSGRRKAVKAEGSAALRQWGQVRVSRGCRVQKRPWQPGQDQNSVVAGSM